MEPSQIRTQNTAWFLLKSFGFYAAFSGLWFTVLDWLFGIHYTLGSEVFRAVFFGIGFTLLFALTEPGSARLRGVSGVLRPGQVGRISVSASERQALDACCVALSNIGARDLHIESARPQRITARMPSSWSFLRGGNLGEKLQVILRDSPNGVLTVEVGSRPRVPLRLSDYRGKNLENVEAFLREVARLMAKDKEDGAE